VSGGWGGGVRCGSNNRDRGSDHNNNNHRSWSRSCSPLTCRSCGDGGGSSSRRRECRRSTSSSTSTTTTTSISSRNEFRYIGRGLFSLFPIQPWHC
jgi:hypothetical protein